VWENEKAWGNLDFLMFELFLLAGQEYSGGAVGSFLIIDILIFAERYKNLEK